MDQFFAGCTSNKFIVLKHLKFKPDIYQRRDSICIGLRLDNVRCSLGIPSLRVVSRHTI